MTDRFFFDIGSSSVVIYKCMGFDIPKYVIISGTRLEQRKTTKVHNKESNPGPWHFTLQCSKGSKDGTVVKALASHHCQAQV